MDKEETSQPSSVNQIQNVHINQPKQLKQPKHETIHQNQPQQLKQPNQEITHENQSKQLNQETTHQNQPQPIKQSNQEIKHQNQPQQLNQEKTHQNQPQQLNQEKTHQNQPQQLNQPIRETINHDQPPFSQGTQYQHMQHNQGSWITQKIQQNQYIQPNQPQLMNFYTNMPITTNQMYPYINLQSQMQSQTKTYDNFLINTAQPQFQCLRILLKQSICK